jgi:hypothetical protein
MRYIPDDNLSYPVLIQLENGSSGSGFYLRSKNNLYFVTAHHVIFEVKDGLSDFSLISKNSKLISYSKDIAIKEPIVCSLNLEEAKNQGLIKFKGGTDVVIIKIAELEPILNTVNFTINTLSVFIIISKNISALLVWVNESLFKPYDQVMISNEVILFGYPNSLGRGTQIDPLRPLLRKGIVAGKNDTNRTIILDCPVYYGNSGGLVVEIEETENAVRKMFCIGVVSQFVPFDEKLLSLQHRTINVSVENSGYSIVIPIDTIISLFNISIS